MRTLLSNGMGYLNGEYTLPTCPACQSCRYTDGRAAYTFRWEGDGWAILQCEVCHCIWVCGDATKAHDVHHARTLKSNDVDHWWIIRQHNEWYNEDIPCGDTALPEQPSAAVDPIVIEGTVDP